MKIILQRVNRASLTSEDFSSEIGYGLMAFVGVNNNDTIFDVKYLAKKMSNLRIFRDENERANLSLVDIGGDIMIVSNFTLQASIKSGTRPDYSHASVGDVALPMYEQLVAETKKYIKNVATGYFGHHMHIDCDLDGPFTIILESEGRAHE